MDSNYFTGRLARRGFLHSAATLAGGLAVSQVLPPSILGAARSTEQKGAPNPGLEAARARFAKASIESVKLSDNLTLLRGPGGNVIALNGPDGKLIVDTFTQGAWDRFKSTLDQMSNAPLKIAINTHWHWDHTDNNANVHDSGATLVAHENTLKRLSETHDLDIINLHFDPEPENALPQKTFKEAHQIDFAGERLTLGHIAPAHTDSDIYVFFKHANVLHMGDVFFNGIYSYIDKGTNGSISGMIAGTGKMLMMVDNETKVVPGHGPLGNKAQLKEFHDMLVTARARIEKLKTGGKSLEEVIAAKPFADLDPKWGKGTLNGDAFAHVVYTTL